MMKSMAAANPTSSTRDRLLLAAVHLFAERGYGRTTMGDIEESAGFTRRGGAVYHHFPSKAAVLGAALDEFTQTVADIGGLGKLLPLPDRQSEVLLLAKWLLGELDRQRDLVRLLEKEGDHLADVRNRLSGDLVDAGYRWTADYGRSALGDREDLDVEALAVVLVGGLVNYRRTQWTFGRPPLALSEERLVAAVTTIVSLVLQAGHPETA